MTMTDGPKRLPPHDSWIALAPGEQLVIDAALQEKWQSKTVAMRTLRGHVLALCFEVEFSLDNVIAYTLFPKAEAPPSDRRREVFDELLLKGPSLRLQSKIELLRKMRARVDGLERVVSPELIKSLDEIRIIRNRFAHYPISFKQVPLLSGAIDISATLECKDASVEITETYLRRFDELIEAAHQGLQEVHQQLAATHDARPERA